MSEDKQPVKAPEAHPPFRWGELAVAGLVGMLRALPWAVGVGLAIFAVRQGAGWGQRQNVYETLGWACIVVFWLSFTWGAAAYMWPLVPEWLVLGGKDRRTAVVIAKCCLTGAILSAAILACLGAALLVLRDQLELSPNPNSVWGLALFGFILTPTCMFFAQPTKPPGWKD